MLGEARHRAGRGTGVVTGYVGTHGRALTAALLEGLEVIPRKTMTYRSSTFTGLDADAVIARRPQVVLIGELAHTSIPGFAERQAVAGYRGDPRRPPPCGHFRASGFVPGHPGVLAERLVRFGDQHVRAVHRAACRHVTGPRIGCTQAEQMPDA